MEWPVNQAQVLKLRRGGDALSKSPGKGKINKTRRVQWSFYTLSLFDLEDYPV